MRYCWFCDEFSLVSNGYRRRDESYISPSVSLICSQNSNRDGTLSRLQSVANVLYDLQKSLLKFFWVYELGISINDFDGILPVVNDDKD